MRKFLVRIQEREQNTKTKNTLKLLLWKMTNQKKADPQKAKGK